MDHDNPWATADPAPPAPPAVGHAALATPDDDPRVAWATAPPASENPQAGHCVRLQHDERAVPPASLDALLRRCDQVSQQIWPPSDTPSDDSWRSGFDNLADLAALLAQLVPPDVTLPPTVQFSASATAKAMNDALKSTRHLPASAGSPLSRLLASKGSLDWGKSVNASPDVVPDLPHVGWRLLEKEDRRSVIEDSKPRKHTGGLLSFWNRRTSSVQAAPLETHRERSSSPARSSLESVKSVPHPSSSRAASPSKTSTPSVPPPPPTASHPSVVVASAPAPSAVSRFLTRFSRARSVQHNSLALSSDDLEFLSDIVPSASDPPDEDTNDSTFGAFTGANISSPLPPKLPPPVPPPPGKTTPSSRPSSTMDSLSVNSTAYQTQGANSAPNIPVLAPPISPTSAVSFSHTQSSPLKHASSSSTVFRQSNTPSIQEEKPSSQHNSPYSSFTLPPAKTPPLLSIPPLLPPPPVSPPQTPRPNAFPLSTTPGYSSTMRTTDTSANHDIYDDDDEFSAFTSFPAPYPVPLSAPYPSQRSPSPPSPPPRRTYERTHYPSSSSTSSVLSPASETSVDHLHSARSSVSALDSFDDFVSPLSVVRGENGKHTPSPPPLPAKSQIQPQQPPLIIPLPSRVYHTHTPSQTTASPTVHTSLMSSAFSVPSVSDAEHRRTQTLVNQAAARGGLLWPNSPESPAVAMALPPPPSSSMSPKSLIEERDLDLLDDDCALYGPLESLPAPLNVAGDNGMDSRVSFPTKDAFGTSFAFASNSGDVLGSRNKLQPSPPPLPSTSTPILSFSSLGTPVPSSSVTKSATLRPANAKQMGGLSAQDLSFFEGL